MSGSLTLFPLSNYGVFLYLHMAAHMCITWCVLFGIAALLSLSFGCKSFDCEFYGRNKELPNFTISSDDDLAMLQATESNESQQILSNEMRRENFEVNLK